MCHVIIGPHCNKTCLRGFLQSKLLNRLLSYRDSLENLNFTCIKFTYNTFQRANAKGADQTAQMRRLVCVCGVHKPLKTCGFLTSRAQLSSSAVN